MTLDISVLLELNFTSQSVLGRMTSLDEVTLVQANH